MNFIRNARLSTKLMTAFGVCALITLAIGLLGGRGVSQMAQSLGLVFSNNLVSVAKTGEAKAMAISQQRNLYSLITATAENADQATKDQILRYMAADRAASEKAFAIYRATPLEDDERAAGDRMEKLWPVYQAQLQQVVNLAQAGDLKGARAVLSGELAQSYDKILSELTIMVESNNRQIGEGSQAADELENQVTTVLYAGIVIAFIIAFALGLFISRLISRPIVEAVTAAQRVAQGDLTQKVSSTSRDETGELINAIGDMQNSLKSTLHQISDAANQLASAAEELNSVTEDGSRGLLKQNDEIQQAATAVNEMTSSVDEVARNAVSTSEASKADDALPICPPPKPRKLPANRPTKAWARPVRRWLR